jgi:hypothetical protein
MQFHPMSQKTRLDAQLLKCVKALRRRHPRRHVKASRGIEGPRVGRRGYGPYESLGPRRLRFAAGSGGSDHNWHRLEVGVGGMPTCAKAMDGNSIHVNKCGT